MKVLLAQMNSVTGDLFGNLEKINRLVSDNKADLFIFPELALTGYCLSDLIEDDSFVRMNKSLLSKIESSVPIVVGFVDYDERKKNDDGRLRKYNAAAVIQNGKILGIAHKSLLPNYRYFDDKRYFFPAKNRAPIEVNIYGKIVRLGISICEDMWDENYSVKPVKELAESNADIIININASPFHPNKISDRVKTIKRHIEETGLPFVYVNTVGSADNGKNIIPFDGQSLVFNKYGSIIAVGKQFEEDSLVVDLSLGKFSAHIPDNDKQFEGLELPEFSCEKEILDALVMSLRDYAKQAGFNKAILPLSGGIDSALGLVIAVEALGSENVIAFNLPSKFNTETTKSIAENLAKNLGVEYKIIPIQEIDDTLKEVFSRNNHEILNSTAKENLHARIRGILMMLESNDSGSLLISNGNKTEIALGYSTLYGDMCGGVSVIGDLSKVDVYRVSKYVNERYGREVIPVDAFTIKPSAELSEGQFDPFDYDVVSPLVDLFVEERLGPLDILDKFKNKSLGCNNRNVFDDSVYEKFSFDSFKNIVYDTYMLLRRSVYKRLQGPPIIAVTKRSFGFDLRETLINKWEGKNEF